MRDLLLHLDRLHSLIDIRLHEFWRRLRSEIRVVSILRCLFLSQGEPSLGAAAFFDMTIGSGQSGCGSGFAQFLSYKSIIYIWIYLDCTFAEGVDVIFCATITIATIAGHVFPRGWEESDLLAVKSACGPRVTAQPSSPEEVAASIQRLTFLREHSLCNAFCLVRSVVTRQVRRSLHYSATHRIRRVYRDVSLRPARNGFFDCNCLEWCATRTPRCTLHSGATLRIRRVYSDGRRRWAPSVTQRLLSLRKQYLLLTSTAFKQCRQMQAVAGSRRESPTPFKSSQPRRQSL
jgi:hypothetical protein